MMPFLEMAMTPFDALVLVMGCFQKLGVLFCGCSYTKSSLLFGVRVPRSRVMCVRPWCIS